MTIRIDGTNTAANPGITGADADTGLQFGTDEVKILTGGTERVTVDSAGRVGVGSAPIETFHIKGGTVTKLNLESNSSTGTSGIQFGDPEDINAGRIQYEHNDNSLNIYVNGLQKLRINEHGRLSGDALAVSHVIALIYARLISHGGCSSGGPSGTFTTFDSSQISFKTVSRTTTSAPTNYTFFGDNSGHAFFLYVGCNDRPAIGVTDASVAEGSTYRSWLCIHKDFVGALLGLPTNTTRTNLP